MLSQCSQGLWEGIQREHRTSNIYREQRSHIDQ